MTGPGTQATLLRTARDAQDVRESRPGVVGGDIYLGLGTMPRLRPLKERDLAILRDVIQIFTESGEPVSSKTLAQQKNNSLSSASLRNIMADLERWGYLSQPHTSAGRIPTSQGYHLFIDSLMRTRTLPASERRLIEETLRKAWGDPDHLTALATHLLSKLSHQVGIIVMPARGDTRVQSVEFVPLPGNRILCVVVSGNGFVDSKVIEPKECLERDELVRISNYLTENFAGMTLREMRDRLLRLMDDERAQVDRFLAKTVSLARQGLVAPREPEVLVDGTESLLTRPELADLERVRRLFDTFADKVRLVRILDECMESTGVRVFIGEDSDLTSELDFSLVATSYEIGDLQGGTLAIFGPSRMEYPRVIPLVHYLGQTLSEALQGSAFD